MTRHDRVPNRVRAGVEARRRQRRDDSGQAMVLAISIIVLLTLIGALLASTVTNEDPLLSYNTKQHAAFSAIEAGVQEYRTRLNGNSNYFNYTSTTPDPTFSAMCVPSAGNCNPNAAIPTNGWNAVLVGTGCDINGVPARPVTVRTTSFADQDADCEPRNDRFGETWKYSGGFVRHP